MSWKNNIPEEFKGSKMFDSYPDDDIGLSNVLKSYAHSQKMLGEKRIKPITDTSTPEEVAEFRRALGVPESKELYNVSGIDDTLAAKIKEAAHKAGLLPKQLEEVVGVFSSDLVERQKELENKKLKLKEETENELRKEYGKDYENKIRSLEAVVGKLGDDDFKELAKTEFGSNKALTKFLVKVADILAEDHVKLGDQSSFKVFEAGTPDQAKRELDLLKRDKDFLSSLRNPADPTHYANKAKYLELLKQISGK